MTEPLQMTVEGREEPLQAPQTERKQPTAEVQTLFSAPQTMPGQLNLKTD